MDYNFSCDNFIVGDNKGKITLYSENNEKVKRVFNAASWFSNGHSNRIFCVKYLNSDHNLFVSGSWDGMIFLWDIRESKPVSHAESGKVNGDTID